MNSFTYTGLILEKCGLIIKDPFIRISNININAKNSDDRYEVSYEIEKYLSEEKFQKYFPPYSTEILTLQHHTQDYSDIFKQCLDDYRRRLRVNNSIVNKVEDKIENPVIPKIPSISKIPVISKQTSKSKDISKPIQASRLAQPERVVQEIIIPHYGTDPFVDTSLIKTNPFLRKKSLSIKTNVDDVVNE